MSRAPENEGGHRGPGGSGVQAPAGAVAAARAKTPRQETAEPATGAAESRLAAELRVGNVWVLWWWGGLTAQPELRGRARSLAFSEGQAS